MWLHMCYDIAGLDESNVAPFPPRENGAERKTRHEEDKARRNAAVQPDDPDDCAAMRRFR